jgi:hypothetical protein
MPAVEFQTRPPKPPCGCSPIGTDPAEGFFAPSEEVAAFLQPLCLIDLPLMLQISDMHRLIYFGAVFTVPTLQRCIRLARGRTQATWIEGQIAMKFAEEDAQSKPKTCDDKDLAGPEDNVL